VWKTVMGYRVQGWARLVWVYFFLVVLGQPCGELLHKYCMHGFPEGLMGVCFLTPLRVWPITPILVYT
jgi:hypothetical protein